MVPLKPFTVEFCLPSAPKQSAVSSISQVEGYIYAVYAEKVIAVDIPFDPNYGWHEAQGLSDLLLRVDPETPPCPARMEFVKIFVTGSRLDPSRPKAPVPLYRYETWVKLKSGGPMMALDDPMLLHPRRLYPLGDYAVVRTELIDSRNEKTNHLFARWILSDPSGQAGADCKGQMEQGPTDTYNSVRHIIAVHPLEVKIPFVLRDIPIPRVQPSTAGAD